jgi:23S rRNA (cytosine1962-C5)-methyltransferase
MFVASEYVLLDFGNGRKLERMGGQVLDRPAPAAEGFTLSQPELWSAADARFEIAADAEQRAGPQRGTWTTVAALPESWIVEHGPIKFEAKLTDFGHVGLFPEQAENWDWLVEQVRVAKQQNDAPLRVLNLFAYTGGSTLVAAAAGAEVTHVDAAKNVVAWGRRNAKLSGLSAAPIRWIVDDALKFTRREVKRGRQYDAVILDPPSYGHGVGGERWKLDDDLPELLAVCRELTGSQMQFALVTCHSPEYGPRRLAESLVSSGFAESVKQIEFGDLSLTSADCRALNAGVFARIGRSK